MSSTIATEVVVIGSGVAGALIASRLASAGVRVVVLEAGGEVDRATAVQTFHQALVKVPECAYPPVPEAMHPVTDRLTQWYRQSGPEQFKSTYLKVLGGTTWHWLGSCPRLLPSDFRLRTQFGRGVDWPISYDTLEPYYLQAESELGVAGDSEEPLGSPRGGPYPMPRIPPTWLDKVVARALEGSRFEVRSTPQARNSVFRDQRIACCGSSSCIPVCPVQAKYDATVHLKRAVAAGVSVLTRSPAVRLELSPEGEIAAVRYRRWDQTEGVIQAKIFVVACNAIETPRLLLASRSATLPDGIANRSDQVGRNLMDHPIQLSWALTDVPVYPYRGPGSTSGIENLRDGEFRKTHSAVRIEIGNDGWSWPTGAPISTATDLAKQGLRGKEMADALAAMTSHHIRLASLTEQEPDPENRISLDPHEHDMYGVPLPNIRYRLSDYVTEGMAWARKLHNEIFQKLNATQISHAPEFFGAGHILGTTRMGTDPERSVVDPQLRSHDHFNLFIAGGSVFPTVGTANPTLTIAALSLRAAEAIQQQLAEMPE
ncbi:GMC family oxidoreductase [Achromobacter sp. F4_2707]|uniref:GMC family oxidoreductase n=1 Tax=Achromobacter sp. F4_2707 TaxID=3114286 RepID=UPI0039C5EE71